MTIPPLFANGSSRLTDTVAIAAVVLLVGVSSAMSDGANVDPRAEQSAFQAIFKKKFPAMAMKDFADGPYPFDAGMLAQWKDIMQMPPYDPAVDEGKKLFSTPFHNGKTYASCLPNGGIGVKQDYPKFDAKSGEVETLEIALNACRKANNEPLLPYEKGDIAAIVAYLASTSDGKPIHVEMPSDPRAVFILQTGKALFWNTQGPKHVSCASCHVDAAGQVKDGLAYAPALGILASFPIYRSAWGELGTVDRRLLECNRATGGASMQAQDANLRALEYYLSYMSNGVPVAGPGARP